jgi:6-phosphogluconolactonase
MYISENQIQIHPTTTELTNAAAAAIEKTITSALEARHTCTLALSGGTTPRDVYARLVTAPHDKIDWRHVHLFWGDERTVPPDDPDSNYKMAETALLKHITIPRENVHRIRGGTDPKTAASEYSRVIRDTMPAGPPRFDLVLLGVGADGHTASLFPGTGAIGEDGAPVAAVYVPSLGTWRITLTLPAINAARRVIFMASGKSKADIVRRLFSLDAPTDDLPASLVRPHDGEVIWMLDKDAASLLPG